MFAKKSEKTTYSVSAILCVGPYVYTEYFRLTLDEIKDKFDSWARNKHSVVRISVTFDGKKYLRVKDYDDLCWVIKYKDDLIFKYTEDYRLSN